MAQLYTIENQEIKVTITDQGAEMISLIGKADNTEYLWQGDPTYWTGHAYNLFPICGRLTEGKYTYRGNTYEMNLHGFFRKSHVDMYEQGDDFISFRMVDSEATRKIYPFGFDFTLTYTLVENTVVTTFDITNTGDNELIFAVGGHPGFNVPLVPGKKFEDYRLRFAENCEPFRVGFDESCFVTHEDVPFALENGTDLALGHQLFDDDAIVLRNMAREVTLECAGDSHSVTVRYPGMQYLGLWHWPRTDAPYVCIEPWCSLPADAGRITVFEEQSDLIALEPGKTYDNLWSITIS